MENQLPGEYLPIEVVSENGNVTVSSKFEGRIIPRTEQEYLLENLKDRILNLPQGVVLEVEYRFFEKVFGINFLTYAGNFSLRLKHEHQIHFGDNPLEAKFIYVNPVPVNSIPKSKKIEGYIQWHGTDVSMDFTCQKCNRNNHVDGYHAFHVQCGYCGATYKCMDKIQLIKDDLKDGITIDGFTPLLGR